MIIKSVAALCNDYDEMVSLSKETHEPILLTRNGHGEMILVPIEIWEKCEAELALLTELLRREQNKLAGAPTSARRKCALLRLR